MKTLEITLVGLLVGCMGVHAQDKGFRITGSVPSSKEGCMVYLDYRSEGNSMGDSVVVKDGKFIFEGIVDEPNYSRMVFDHEGQGKYMVQNVGDRLYFYLGNENYDMAITDSLCTATITGSPLHDAYIAYLDQIGGSFMDIVDMAGKSMAAVPNDEPDRDEKLRAIHEKYDNKLKDRRLKALAFAKTHPNSFFSIDALADAANSHPLSEIEPIFLTLSEEVRNLTAGKEIASRILADKTVKIGNIAPDFTQPDIDGNAVSLSDFRGGYVLVDFWASWCAPCRAENPNLKRAYENYKGKGLEVLAVSLDDTKGRAAWLKAIETDGLPWIHVSDLKGWSNDAAVLYGVRGVPQNYLIDPEGKIIASNLRDEQLHAVLEDVFDNH